MANISDAAAKRLIDNGRRSPHDLADVPVDIDTALPGEVASVLYTTPAGLAQMRYRGNGPKFIRAGGKILYRWSDVRAYLDSNTMQRTDDPRGVGI